MTTWAIIRGGYACDVVSGNTIDLALAGRFAPGWIEANKPAYVQVPPGTESGAKDKGDGTYTNPAVPAAPARDKGADEFMRWLVGLFPNREIGLQKLLIECRAQTSATPLADLDYQCRYFETWLLVTQVFTKADFTARTLPLTQTTPKIIGTQPRLDAIAAW